MTVLNEAESLPGFLDGLWSQVALPEEIIVVDGGSSDGTIETLRGWCPPPGVTCTVEVLPGANISQGRNAAVERAGHERILVTDAGTTLAPTWAQALFRAFSTGASVVSGFFIPEGDSLLEQTLACAVTPMLDEIDPNTFLPSSRSVAFTKAAWSRAGGYPEWLDYCEDLVFDLSLRDNGEAFFFAPEATVTWSARPTLRAFAKQYYRYARGDGKAMLWGQRHAVRYAAYLVGGGTALAARHRPALMLPLTVGFAAYQAKFCRRVWRRRHQFATPLLVPLLLTPVVVVTGDLAKMLGYPVGLLWRCSSTGAAVHSAAGASRIACRRRQETP